MTKKPVIIRPKAKLWFEDGKGQAIFGEGVADLLAAIDKYKSISAASKHTGMSYRYALHRVSLSEKHLERKLVKRFKGGKAGGGAELTVAGEKMLKQYRKTQRSIEKFLETFQRASEQWR